MGGCGSGVGGAWVGLGGVTTCPLPPLPQIPYRCVEVNPLTKAELKWSEYKKVPVVVVDGEQVGNLISLQCRRSVAMGLVVLKGAGAGGGRRAGGWTLWGSV